MSVTLAPRGAHGGERGVAGRIDEGDLVAVALDLIGADVLGDAAGLAGDDVGLADGVEQRRLAVIDVAHDGDHRRSAARGRRRRRGPANRPSSTSASATRRTRVAHLLGDDLGGVGVDDVGGLDHLALLHQQLDDVDGALGHAVGELLDGDRLGNGDFAHDLLARAGLVRAGAFALAAAADRGERAGALGVVERVGKRQLAAAAVVDALDRLRLGRTGRRLDATAQAAGAIVFLDLRRLADILGTRTGRRDFAGDRSLGFVFAEAAARGFLGARTGMFLGLVAGVFLGLAALGLGPLAGQPLVLGGAARGGVDRRAGAPRPRAPWRRPGRGRGHRSRRAKAGAAPGRRARSRGSATGSGAGAGRAAAGGAGARPWPRGAGAGAGSAASARPAGRPGASCARPARCWCGRARSSGERCRARFRASGQACASAR